MSGASPGGNWSIPTEGEFLAARNRSTRPQFLSEGPPPPGSRLYLRCGGAVGFAVTPKRDLVNVFNNGGPRGAGGIAVDEAVRLGALTLDCYDGHNWSLRIFYLAHGFGVTGRMAFNPDYAPKGWDYGRYGSPDVVFMALGPQAISLRYTAEQWDEAKVDSLRAAKPLR
jgi:hypothetical protein